MSRNSVSASERADARDYPNGSDSAWEQSPKPASTTRVALRETSYDLYGSDTYTSNPSFGAIGAPSPRSPRAHLQGVSLGHAKNIRNLVQDTSAHWRNSTTINRQSVSYVNHLSSWRRPLSAEGPESAPASASAGAKRASHHSLQGGRRCGGFKRMDAILNRHASAEKPTSRAEILTHGHLQLGISHNYKGQVDNPANISADIPDSENCSLWLTFLPPGCTYRQLLAAVALRRPGKVYATHINPPNPDAQPHQASRHHSAAKIQFYRPEDARLLLDAIRPGGFYIEGYRVRATYNRVRARAQARGNATTRCLELSGPAYIVDPAQLPHLFGMFFRYDTDEVVVHGPEDPGRGRADGEPARQRLEWRFGSWRAQAAVARLLVAQNYPGQIRARYVPDPCDRLTSAGF